MLSHSRYNAIPASANTSTDISQARSPPAGNDTMRGVQPERISGTSPYEAAFGFSRAIVAGGRILVAGTAPIPPAGGPPPSGAYDQARLCLELIATALARAGARLEHVIRTRMYLTDAGHWPEVARAHGEVFADVRPAATAVIVAGLLDPAWLIEIEAEALLPDR
jgi:enamine deaminase RidA (YjgF/YER057c/UK114 family)